MASNQTANYGLNQWEASDQVLRTEFNQDNQKIDTALKNLSSAMTTGLAQKYGTDNAFVKSGSYTGNGNSTITITTGFQPSLVMLFSTSGNAGNYDYVFLVGDQYAQLLISQFTAQTMETDALQFTSTGFVVPQVSAYSNGFNTADWSYRYIAFR